MKSFFLSVGDPDRKDFLQGYTALHYAAKEDHLECLELLLEAGGDYNITNNNGTTCLDIPKGQCLDLLQSLSKSKQSDNVARPTGTQTLDPLSFLYYTHLFFLEWQQPTQKIILFKKYMGVENVVVQEFYSCSIILVCVHTFYVK